MHMETTEWCCCWPLTFIVSTLIDVGKQVSSYAHSAAESSINSFRQKYAGRPALDGTHGGIGVNVVDIVILCVNFNESFNDRTMRMGRIGCVILQWKFYDFTHSSTRRRRTEEWGGEMWGNERKGLKLNVVVSMHLPVCLSSECICIRDLIAVKPNT